jgi:diguanylate cyclase (GGDEF)-like protein
MVRASPGNTTQRMRVPRATAPATRALALVVIHGERLGARLDVHDVPALIGRSPECDFQIDHRSVSRHHCKVWHEDGASWVADLESTNRTFVNEKPVTRTQLHDGDQLTVGETVFKAVRTGSVEARYHDALYHLATTDSLTQLYNRRKFRELFEAAFAQPGELSLVFVDLDHFKRINDDIGHIAGDEVLRAASAALREALLPGDIAGRLGGEEFAIAMHDTPLSRAVERAEGFRAAISAARAPVDGRDVHCTASVGVTSRTKATPTVPAMMREADVQLFRAKAAGRDRVCATGH